MLLQLAISIEILTHNSFSFGTWNSVKDINLIVHYLRLLLSVSDRLVIQSYLSLARLLTELVASTCQPRPPIAIHHPTSRLACVRFLVATSLYRTGIGGQQPQPVLHELSN